MRLLLLMCVGLPLLLACKAAQADNPELLRLALADQADRTERPEGGWDDETRRRRVIELLATDAVKTPRDKLHAALILQHTAVHICEGQLRSISPENYLLAHHLARSAWQAGFQDARLMVAQTIDRYLSFTEGRQKYGTNRLVDLDSGEEYLPYIDRSVTDAERAELGVPPLDTLLKATPERAPPAGDE